MDKMLKHDIQNTLTTIKGLTESSQKHIDVMVSYFKEHRLMSENKLNLILESMQIINEEANKLEKLVAKLVS